MGLFDNFPYTNFHELNLDWILKELKELDNTITQFVSINALKYADPIQWDITSQYEKNTIVIDPQSGTAYISVQPVPAGVSLTNTDYWTVVFDLERFVTKANNNFTLRVEEQATTTATFATPLDGWVIWGGDLYQALTNILAGDQYVVDSNIKRITVEDVISIIINDLGELSDLTTTDKSNIVAAINEVATALITTVGDLSDLDTTDKSNIVAAINELNTLVTNITTNLHITTPELYGAVGDGVTDDTAAVQSAFDNGNYIILSNDYKITDTLFLTGNKVVVGGGTLHGWLPAISANEYLIVLGASAIGTAAEVFTGAIDGINIIAHNGNYNYCIGAVNADNCQFKNITFDFSNGDCHNKMLYIGNDSDISPDNSTDKNYLVDNCYFIYDSDYDSSYNQCESVGILRRSDVVISNCTTRYAKDDIGVHHCHFVEIRNNKMFDNFYARIYVSNSTHVTITNNQIIENPNRWTMGIMFEWETTAVSSNIEPEVFEITDNTIDYRGNLTATTTYGIRVRGAKHGIIARNILLSDSYQYGRIVVENESPSGSLTSLLTLEDVEICDNICSSIFHGIGTGSSTDAIEPLFIHDNKCQYSYTSSNINNISRNNAIINPSSGSSLDIVIPTQYVPYNNNFSFTGTGSGAEQLMSIDGITEKRFAKKSKLSNYYRMKLAEEITLSGSDYYRFFIKKNGTTIRQINLQGSTISATAISDNIFEPGDILTVTFNYSGTAPSPQPSGILLQLFNYEFENC